MPSDCDKKRDATTFEQLTERLERRFFDPRVNMSAAVMCRDSREYSHVSAQVYFSPR